MQQLTNIHIFIINLPKKNPASVAASGKNRKCGNA
jgi:hypothetical protein